MSLQNSIARRLKNLQTHNANPELQRLAWALSAKDIVHWVNNWVWTYDPRLESPFIPMDLFPKQEEFLRWLEEREQTGTDGLGEKTRDMGFTWLCVIFLVHRWLFREGFKGSVGSRKELLVDRLGDPDSILEKARMLLRRLPLWMMPSGFDWSRDDNFCKLMNPANGSTITGEAGDQIGRGGRSSIYFLDEAAYIERPERVEAALSANTNVRIYVSTPNGMGNPFYAKRTSGKISVFMMSWRDDPRKNHWQIVRESDNAVIDSGPGGTEPGDVPNGCRLAYPWYAEMEDKLDPVTLAQEVDIDYAASIEGIAIPAKWVQAAINLDRRIRLPKTATAIAGMDVADEGAAETVVAIRRGPVVGPFFARTQGGTTDTANWALDHCHTEGVKRLNFDVVGVGAGIAGTYKVKARSGTLDIIATGINVGVAPTDAKWPDGRTSKEIFTNLKAELWGIVRRRFEKTYEYVKLGVQHPLDELISIPDEPKLITQLSSVLKYTNEAGKTMVERKQDLRSRGVASPDWAEALMLTFAPTRHSVRTAVGGERTELLNYKPR